MRYSSSAILMCSGTSPGNCPPMGESPGPETSMRGPTTEPSLIAVLSATSPKRPEFPRSRTVVIPASRKVRARAAPCSARSGVPSAITAFVPSPVSEPASGSSR